MSKQGFQIRLFLVSVSMLLAIIEASFVRAFLNLLTISGFTFAGTQYCYLCENYVIWVIPNSQQNMHLNIILAYTVLVEFPPVKV